MAGEWLGIILLIIIVLIRLVNISSWTFVKMYRITSLMLPIYLPSLPVQMLSHLLSNPVKRFLSKQSKDQWQISSVTYHEGEWLPLYSWQSVLAFSADLKNLGHRERLCKSSCSHMLEVCVYALVFWWIIACFLPVLGVFCGSMKDSTWCLFCERSSKELYSLAPFILSHFQISQRYKQDSYVASDLPWNAMQNREMLQHRGKRRQQQQLSSTSKIWTASQLPR